MPSYSHKAAPALAYLKRNYNDIDIFVEDTSCPNMWLKLVRSCLPKNMRLGSVNMLGGREKVVAACSADQKATRRPKLYIVDGDFDFLLGRRKLNLKYLHRVRGYCVENILISKKSAVEIGTLFAPELDEAEVERQLDFESWIERNSTLLAGLFIVYAVSYLLTPEQQTVKFSVERLYLNGKKSIEICPQKTTKRILEVARYVRKQVGLKSFLKAFRDVRKREQRLRAQQVISGKDYLLPIFHIRMCRILGYRGTRDQLKTLLAAVFDHSMDPQFARRIQQLNHPAIAVPPTRHHRGGKRLP